MKNGSGQGALVQLLLRNSAVKLKIIQQKMSLIKEPEDERIASQQCLAAIQKSGL